VTPCHEVTGARPCGGLDQQLAVRTDRLKAVMLDDHRPARKEAQDKGDQSGPCNMNDMGGAYHMPQLDESWLADDTKRKRPIIKFIRLRLCDECNFELWIAACCAKPGEAAGQRKHKCFNAADARRKKMRIDKQLHSRNFCEAAGAV